MITISRVTLNIVVRKIFRTLFIKVESKVRGSFGLVSNTRVLTPTSLLTKTRRWSPAAISLFREEVPLISIPRSFWIPTTPSLPISSPWTEVYRQKRLSCRDLQECYTRWEKDWKIVTWHMYFYTIKVIDINNGKII